MRLIESLATTEALAELFSDESVLRAMLDFEVSLARVEAELKIIPRKAAVAIARAAKNGKFNTSSLAAATLRAGTPGIPIVKALTEATRKIDREAAGFVHWGATSQDVADTAMILLLKRAQPVIEKDLSRLENALRGLAKDHASAVMLGRTLMQPAPPVTFGLKAAGWLDSIASCHADFRQSFSKALMLQFGGASGTLAALGNRGEAAGRKLASELGLSYPEAPWHTRREHLARLVSSCGVLTGALGKIAADIALLMQAEVAEVAEPGGQGRGGSSTMPHKRNPIGCAVTLAAANRAPGLVASFLTGMVQAHERAVGGWQSEWPILASTIQSTGLATASMLEVAQGLIVYPRRMRSNLDATRGLIFAEKAMMVLAPQLGRDVAHRLIEEATREAVSGERHLSDVLAEIPEILKILGTKNIDQLERPEKYLGSAERFRKRLLDSAARTSKFETRQE